jgi:hypothetical protein
MMEQAIEVNLMRLALDLDSRDTLDGCGFCPSAGHATLSETRMKSDFGLRLSAFE